MNGARLAEVRGIVGSYGAVITASGVDNEDKIIVQPSGEQESLLAALIKIGWTLYRTHNDGRLEFVDNRSDAGHELVVESMQGTIYVQKIGWRSVAIIIMSALALIFIATTFWWSPKTAFPSLVMFVLFSFVALSQFYGLEINMEGVRYFSFDTFFKWKTIPFGRIKSFGFVLDHARGGRCGQSMNAYSLVCYGERGNKLMQVCLTDKDDVQEVLLGYGLKREEPRGSVALIVSGYILLALVAGIILFFLFNPHAH